MDDWFTIYQCRAKEPENIEISTPISWQVWLFWCEADMVSLNPKRLPSKLIIKSAGLKM